MHTIIRSLKPTSRSRRPQAASPAVFRKPHYDCADRADAIKLTVHVPGVDAAGVEISTQGPDLTVTARKAHFVRVNWQALHLENAQRDYQLSLRLGRSLDFASMEAEIHDGVLTLRLPRRRRLSWTIHYATGTWPDRNVERTLNTSSSRRARHVRPLPVKSVSIIVRKAQETTRNLICSPIDD